MERDFEVGLNMINLSGKEAIVTGAGSGIGRGICSVLALAGANVLVTDISGKGAEDTLKHCGYGDKFRARQMDVTKIQLMKLFQNTSRIEKKLIYWSTMPE